MYEAGGKADSAPFAMPNAELIAPTKLYLPLFRLTYSGPVELEKTVLLESLVDLLDGIPPALRGLVSGMTSLCRPPDGLPQRSGSINTVLFFHLDSFFSFFRITESLNLLARPVPPCFVTVPRASTNIPFPPYPCHRRDT